MTAETARRVSVVLPVFNDEVRLEKCLQALEDQTYPKTAYEVIVVDNASTADIKTIVDCFGQAAYVHEAKQGSYAARNKGLTLATGEIIAFTDSDCVPAPNWIERGVSTLTSVPDCALVGGAIELFYRDEDNPTGVELYERATGFPQRKYVEESKFAATANVFTYRGVLDEVGVFNDELKSGGDAEWGKRVHAAGLLLHYADDVVVAHPARSTYAEMYAKTVRVMSGLPALRPGAVTKRKAVRQFLRGLIPPFGRIRRIVGQAGDLSALQTLKLVSVVLFINYVWVLERARLQCK